jgi:hypothetical protein
MESLVYGSRLLFMTLVFSGVSVVLWFFTWRNGDGLALNWQRVFSFWLMWKERDKKIL